MGKRGREGGEGGRESVCVCIIQYIIISVACYIHCSLHNNM